MTPEQHNKYLGWTHLAYAALHSLMGVVVSLIVAVMFRLPDSSRGNPPPPGFFIALAVFMLVFTVGISIPSMIAGYALLKRKRWAKIAAIVAGAFAAMQVPFGTAVCVYTFWFLLSEPGRLLYDQPAKSLSPGSAQDWARTNQEKTHEYVPPVTPPDWR
jgi:chromate transport protein ChrA